MLSREYCKEHDLLYNNIATTQVTEKLLEWIYKDFKAIKTPMGKRIFDCYDDIIYYALNRAFLPEVKAFMDKYGKEIIK